MKATTITENEIKNLKVASLPTRPTSPKAFGGNGYTATQMKEAFDKLPLFIIERFNALISDILDTGADSIAHEIATGIKSGHTLSDLFEDISNGSFLNYVVLDNISLLRHFIALRKDTDAILKRLGMSAAEV